MYTRTPNYMWMLKRLYDSPYSYHWNEWGLKSGVRVLNAHRKRRISTNTIKLNIKREREKESGEQKKSEFGQTKDSPMHEIRWNVTRSYLPNDFHSFTPNDIATVPMNSSNNNQEKKCSCRNENDEYLLLIFFGMKSSIWRVQKWAMIWALCLLCSVYICVHDVSVWYLLCDFFASACALIRIIAHIWYGNGQINRTHISSSACQICCRLNYESKSESQSAKGANKIRRFLYTASTSVGSFELHKIFAQFLCWKCHGSSS